MADETSAPAGTSAADRTTAIAAVRRQQLDSKPPEWRTTVNMNLKFLSDIGKAVTRLPLQASYDDWETFEKDMRSNLASNGYQASDWLETDPFLCGLDGEDRDRRIYQDLRIGAAVSLLTPQSLCSSIGVSEDQGAFDNWLRLTKHFDTILATQYRPLFTEWSTFAHPFPTVAENEARFNVIRARLGKILKAPNVGVVSDAAASEFFLAHIGPSFASVKELAKHLPWEYITTVSNLKTKEQELQQEASLPPANAHSAKATAATPNGSVTMNAAFLEQLLASAATTSATAVLKALESHPGGGRRGGRSGASGDRGRVKFSGDRGAGGHRNGRADDPCYRCQQPGHIARNCMAAAPVKSERDTSYESAPQFSLSVLTDASATDHMEWLVDSGASVCLTGTQDLFHHGCTPLRVAISVANDAVIYSSHVGAVHLPVSDGTGKAWTIVLPRVLFVPGMTRNLLGPGTLGSHFLTTIQGSDTGHPSCTIFDLRTHTAYTCRMVGALPFLDPTGSPCHSAHPAVAIPAADLLAYWHAVLGHVPRDVLRRMVQQGLVEGLSPGQWLDAPMPECHVCATSKLKRSPFNGRLPRATKRLGRVSIDLHGPLRYATLGGNKYAMVLVDDKTDRCWVRMLKEKSQASKSFKHWLVATERELDAKLELLEIFKSDNGGEFTSTAFREFLADRGIQYETTVPDSSAQNARAERMIAVLTEMVRVFLDDSGLPPALAGEAFMWAATIKSALPTRSSANISGTPHEAWFGTKPDVSRFLRFGTQISTWQPPNRRPNGKLSPVGEIMYFVGLDESSPGIRVYDPKRRRIQVTRDFVVLDRGARLLSLAESRAFPASPPPPPPVDPSGPRLLLVPDADLEDPAPDPGEPLPNPGEPVPNPGEQDPVPHPGAPAPNPIPDPQPVPMPQIANPEPGRPQRNRRAPVDPNHLPSAHETWTRNREQLLGAGLVSRMGYGLDDEQQEPARAPPPQGGERANVAASEHLLPAPDGPDPTWLPQTLEEALRIPVWKDAITKELDGMIASKSFRPILQESLSPRQRRSPLTWKWVFTVKKAADGSVTGVKARLTIRGFRQRPGEDFDLTSAEVIHPTTTKTVFAEANQRGWEIHVIDVDQAFLQAHADKLLIAKAPPGLELVAKPDDWATDLVEFVELLKSIYGLKQAAYLWAILLEDTLINMGFEPSTVDSKLFIKRDYVNGVITLVGTHVDDMFVTSNSPAAIRQFKSDFAAQFKIKDKGEASEFVGIRILRNKAAGTLSLDLVAYTEQLLTEFKMHDCRPVDLPAVIALQDIRPPATPEERRTVEDRGVRRLVGLLLYLAYQVRPDITAAVSFASRRSHDPSESLWSYLMGILRYLKKTTTYGLIFRKSPGEPEVSVYTDSSFSDDNESRKSTFAWVGRCGEATVSWASRRAKSTAVSTMEAEYVGLFHGVTEAEYLARLTAEIRLHSAGEPRRLVPAVFCDNQAAISLAEHPCNHNASKHIDNRYHYSREAWKRRSVDIGYVETNEMVADILTKNVVDRAKFAKFRAMMGVGDITARGSVSSIAVMGAGDHDRHPGGSPRPAARCGDRPGG